MSKAALAMAVLVLLAGCAQPKGPSDQAAAPTEEPRDARGSTGVFSLAPGSTTEAWDDVIDLSIRFGVPMAPWDQQSAKFFQVNETITAALIEVVWDDPVMDLDAYAIPDNCDVPDPCNAELLVRQGDFHQSMGGAPGQPDSPSRLFLDGPTLRSACDACQWTMGAWTQAAAAQVTARIYVTLFTGDVPEGFTAIPAA
jgi:hypothetical protein